MGNGDRINTDRPYSAPGVSFERNAFRNESIKDVNLRAQWKFDFNGTRRVIFSFEAFNLFNWDNIELSGTPVTNYCAAPIASDCGFGAATNPNFLSLTDENPTSARVGAAAAQQHPRCAAADSAGGEVPVLVLDLAVDYADGCIRRFADCADSGTGRTTKGRGWHLPSAPFFFVQGAPD